VIKAGHPCSHGNVKSRSGGVFLLGAIIALPCVGALGGCGARDNHLSSAATIALDTVAWSTSDETSIQTAASTTTSQPASTVAPAASEQVEFDDAVPPTTAIAADLVTYPPDPMATTPVVSDASVQALAAVLGVDGELEQRDGEHGAGQCIGRLEPRGLCVNVPLWGAWQYWDLSAQKGPGASDEQARSIAVGLFAQLGVDPGAVTSIEPNGPLPQVKFRSGAFVMIAQDGRIAMVIAGTSLIGDTTAAIP
jgi:hypothetical protein